MDDRENEEKKPKFKIVDKRRIDADDVKASDAPPEQEIKDEYESGEDPELRAVRGDEPEVEKEAEHGADDGPPGESAEDQDPLEYMNIVFSFLQTLVSVIWVHIGLVPHPQTKLVTKKLEEARKSIELFELIYGSMREELPGNLQQELDGALQDMKANYVNQLP